MDGERRGGGVEVRDKVEGVCSVILACRSCFGGVMACKKNRPLPRHPIHPHTHTYTFINLISNSISPHHPLLACLITLLISSVIISLAKKPSSHHPATPSVLYPPAPWSPFLCLFLVFWPPCLRLELPLIISTSSLPSLALSSSNISYILFKSKPCSSTPQAKFCQCFLCSHLTPMPDAATLFHLRYFNCTQFFFDLICHQNP